MFNFSLVGCNKRIFYAAVGTPGNTRDAFMLQSALIYIYYLIIQGKRFSGH